MRPDDVIVGKLRVVVRGIVVGVVIARIVVVIVRTAGVVIGVEGIAVPIVGGMVIALAAASGKPEGQGGNNQKHEKNTRSHCFYLPESWGTME